MNYKNARMHALTDEFAYKISNWEYGVPYQRYNFKGRPNGYLMNKETWGTEQFCLLENNEILGYVSCQFENDKLWVGWSLCPDLCGKRTGHLFALKCIEEIRKQKRYNEEIYLRVAASNIRAIKAYQRAGFAFSEIIQEEVAYTNNIEDFWIMKIE